MFNLIKVSDANASAKYRRLLLALCGDLVQSILFQPLVDLLQQRLEARDVLWNGLARLVTPTDFSDEIFSGRHGKERHLHDLPSSCQRHDR